MDRCDLAYLALRGVGRRSRLVGSILRDVTGLGECNVRLYLAFFRQRGIFGMVSDGASSYDGAGEFYPLPRSVVDLALFATLSPSLILSQGYVF